MLYQLFSQYKTLTHRTLAVKSYLLCNKILRQSRKRFVNMFYVIWRFFPCYVIVHKFKVDFHFRSTFHWSYLLFDCIAAEFNYCFIRTVQFNNNYFMVNYSGAFVELLRGTTKNLRRRSPLSTYYPFCVPQLATFLLLLFHLICKS